MNNIEEKHLVCEFCNQNYEFRNMTKHTYNSYYCNNCKYWQLVDADNHSSVRFYAFYFVSPLDNKNYYIEKSFEFEKIVIYCLEAEYDFHDNWIWDHDVIVTNEETIYDVDIHPGKLNRIHTLLNFS